MMMNMVAHRHPDNMNIYTALELQLKEGEKHFLLNFIFLFMKRSQFPIGNKSNAHEIFFPFFRERKND